MKALLKVAATLLLILGVLGCANAPVAGTPTVPRGATITVEGFVKTPGNYPYHQGMTLSDALDEAGGYGSCSSCEEFYKEHGSHPTFSRPPKVKRDGQLLQVPKAKAEWTKFTVQPGDEIRFQHIMF